MASVTFTEAHEDFRQMVRRFFMAECVPHVAEWERDGIVDRDVWTKAGQQGLLGWQAPPEFGGLGIDDFRYNAIVTEEMYETGTVGVGFTAHNNVVAPYLVRLTTNEQKERWLPGFASGEFISAIAITEPTAGSDMAAIRTTARRVGDEYVLNGSKTFITNGILADLVVVAAKTDPEARHRGISLIVVERGMPGFSRGPKLDKVGQRSRDTAELFFDDVRVPASNLLGEENKGFYYLMQNLPEERMSAVFIAIGTMRRAFALTLEHVRSRQVFGASLGALQATRFTMAELHTEIQAAEAYADNSLNLLLAGELSAADAAGIKYWMTDLQCSVVDRCLQLFGGYGYMNEYEIARLWRDSRVQKIYAGTNEIMKEIVGRSLKLAGE
ncbi:MAG: acyl-CoA dehydrogenase family protein [Acidimicrobiales bacterium]